MGVQKRLKKIKCIGFDMDGTLYPETKEIQDFKKELLCKCLVEKDKISFSEAREIRDREFAKTGSYTCVLKHHGIEDTNKIINDKGHNNQLIKLIRFDPGLEKFLKKIKKKYKTFLVTHTNKKYAVPRMSKAGINYQDCFDVCIFGDSGLLKTSREVFDLALSKLNFKPEEVLYVGDRETVDIVVPKKIGMLTIMVGSNSSLADYRLDSIYDLPNIL